MNKLFPFQQADDIAAATWVTNSLQEFATNVVSIVPAGFPAYARIYHPAWRIQNNARSQVRWFAMAQDNNRVAHRTMQWPSILGRHDIYQQHPHSATSDMFFEHPSEGSLPPEIARLFWQVLAHHTTTAATCWFAVWEGFGCLTKEVQQVPSFAIPGRQFHLFKASIEAVESSFCSSSFGQQSANLWWPADRAWCVATEIDFMTTYVAGTDEAIAALMACADLEIDRVEPSDRVTWDSDTINPVPSQNHT